MSTKPVFLTRPGSCLSLSFLWCCCSSHFVLLLCLSCLLFVRLVCRAVLARLVFRLGVWLVAYPSCFSSRVCSSVCLVSFFCLVFNRLLCGFLCLFLSRFVFVCSLVRVFFRLVVSCRHVRLVFFCDVFSLFFVLVRRVRPFLFFRLAVLSCFALFRRCVSWFVLCVFRVRVNVPSLCPCSCFVSLFCVSRLCALCLFLIFAPVRLCEAIYGHLTIIISE